MKIQKVTNQKYGGILYVDKIEHDDTADSVIVGKIIHTDNADLIGTRINQMSARHVRPTIVRVKTKT